MVEKIAFAADHGGFELKNVLIAEALALGNEPLDLGTHGPEPVDYPDFSELLCGVVIEGRAPRGVLICGTGIGMSIAANRHAQIRAALCHDGLTARLSRQHNDANVLVLGGRLLGPELAKDCLRVFLTTAFDGGRHARRLAKLS